MSRPVKTWKFGRVDLAMWKFENNGKINYSFTIQKSYKSGEEWKQTGYLAESDLKALAFGLFGMFTDKYLKREKQETKQETRPEPVKESNDDDDVQIPF